MIVITFSDTKIRVGTITIRIRNLFMIVSHNLTAMNANRQFNITRQNKSKLSEKLSSGYRINRASDDAAGLAISEKMRRQIRGLNRAADNIQDGISLCNVADGALNEIHDIMQRERQLLIQAGNDTNSDSDKEYIQQEINQLSEEFDRIFDSTTFNEIELFKGIPTVLKGPDTRTDTIGPDVDTKTESNMQNSIYWVKKGDAAPSGGTDISDTQDSDVVIERFLYEEEIGESVYPDIEPNHPKFRETDRADTTTTVTDIHTEVTKTYSKITDPDELKQYTQLKEPSKTIGADGYVNRLTNIAGNVDLSCAMSQLGIKVDGKLIDVSLYGGRYSQGTTYSADGMKAETKYKLQDGLYLQQTVTMNSDRDTYSFDFTIMNDTGKDHSIELRFAFDVMNEYASNVNNGSSSFTINGEFASVNVSGSSGRDGSLDKAVLGDIGAMYGQGNWDASSVVDDKKETSHMGAGYWWSASSADGSEIEVGKVKYGPINYNMEPYGLETKTEKTTTVTKTIVQDFIETDILPKYLDIQAGTEKGMLIPIRLWDLSCEKMGVRAGTEVSVNSVGTSLRNIDQAFEKINHIRSYYGAMTNRLEHAYRVNKNSEENTQAAESVIRDTDMARTMVEYSNHNILEQAGNSMLVQANQSNQDVLALLR